MTLTMPEVALPQTFSGSFDPGLVLGETVPRVFTPPLRELTPETSYGFAVIEFAREVVRRPLDPWQEWAVIHAGELLPNGLPRFRKILIMVARQNGKTELLVILSAFWMFVEAIPLILGTSTKLAYAKESWQKLIKLVETTRELDEFRSLGKGHNRWYRSAAGEEECFTIEGARYKIAASNEEGGRSLTIHRLVLDELRQHKDYRAWNAAVPAGNAVDDFQVWAISNAGTDDSIVLNELRDASTKFIETGEGDDQLFLAEWSAHPGSSPLDLRALAQANPNLGRRISVRSLLGDAHRAVQKGGEVLTGFMTESMCIHVPKLDGAVDPEAWDACYAPGDLADTELRRRIVLCLDVSPDRLHASLAAAAPLPDGRVRVEIVAAFDGQHAVTNLRKALPTWDVKIKPRAIGWFPTGPAAVMAADIMTKNIFRPGVEVAEIKQEVAAVCMGFAEQVSAKRILHKKEPILNDHVTGASKLWTGDVWKFSRKGEGHCDAAYAAAGAIHLARTLRPQDRIGIV